MRQAAESRRDQGNTCALVSFLPFAVALLVLCSALGCGRCGSSTDSGQGVDGVSVQPAVSPELDARRQEVEKELRAVSEELAETRRMAIKDDPEIERLYAAYKASMAAYNKKISQLPRLVELQQRQRDLVKDFTGLTSSKNE